MFVALETRPFIYFVARHFQREATNSLFQWNTEITGYFKVCDVESARKLFVEIPQKNVVTWNCMISGYVRNGMITEAREIFDSMPAKNVISWTAMLTGYAKNGRLDEARVLFDAIKNKNVACWNAMISGYVSFGGLEEARAFFDAMPVKNDVTWATLIEGYFEYSDVNEAERLFVEASGEKVLLYNTMIVKYGEIGLAEKSWDLFTRMPRRDEASWTSMISCFMRIGDVEKARKLFDEMPTKDVVAWTVMIKGYVDNKRIDLAHELFDKMSYKDVVAWNSMLSGYAHHGTAKDAYDFFTQMPKRNTVSWNSMLRAYVLQGDIGNALLFFEKIPKKDKTSWNTVISGCQGEEALSLYINMLSSGFKPDQGTLTSIISICGTLALQAWGSSVHAFIIKNGYENDSMVTSSLISMYSKCGFLNDASLVFETMQNRDTVAWNSMILAKARHRSAEEVLNLFHRMIDGGFKPNHVTFLELLASCAHSGSVRLGWEYFKAMERWNLIPKPEHISSLVDLLARSGLLEEAFELVSKFSVDLPSYAWETLLSACNIQRNYELSDSIAEKILRCHPSDSAMSVLQCNILSARGMWKDAAQVRAKLKENRLRKELGCSWIDINGGVSCFSCNDKSHIRATDVYNVLEGLTLLIEEHGQVR